MLNIKMKLIIAAIIIVFLASSVVVIEANSLNNSKPHVAARSGPIKVACVGDSITEQSEYPADLQSKLGSNYTVGNFGVTGSTVSLNSWKPYVFQTAFKNAQDFNPDIVIIMLGTNDDLYSLQKYNDTFQADYYIIINAFQKLNTDPTILVANPPPIFNNSSDLNPSYMDNTIIPLTDSLANSMNIPIINVHDAIGNQTDLLKDGVHPNSEGSEVIADQVYNAIPQMT